MLVAPRRCDICVRGDHVIVLQQWAGQQVGLRSLVTEFAMTGSIRGSKHQGGDLHRKLCCEHGTDR